MFILELNLKCFLYKWKRTVVFVCLAALLAAAAGLAGSRLLHGRHIAEPISIVLVDEDDTFESRAFYVVLTGVESYKDFISFEKTDRAAALDKIRANEAAAVFIIPEGFTEHVKNGLNTPYEVIYNSAMPLSAGLTRYYSDAFASMLAASQAGVYAGLDFAWANGSEDDYKAVFRDVNMRYLSLVGERETMTSLLEVSATGGVGIFAYYALHVYVFIMMSGVVLYADIFQKNFNKANALRLSLAGTGGFKLFAANTASLTAMLACANAILGAAVFVCARAFGLSFRVSPAVVPVVLLFLLCVSVIGVLAALMFEDVFSMGVFVSVFSMASLFFSGGIVPEAFFPDALALPARFMLNYWVVRLLAGCFTGNAELFALWPVLVWLVCCACCALLFVCVKRKAGAAL